MIHSYYKKQYIDNILQCEKYFNTIKHGVNVEVRRFELQKLNTSELEKLLLSHYKKIADEK